MARRWRDLLLSLGESLLEVLGAEVEALRSDLRASGRQVFITLALAAGALFLLFWSVGAAGFVLFQVATLWLAKWAAALIVLGLFLVAALILSLIARSRWLAIEGPAETIRRRFDDHVDWWEGQLPERSATPDRDRLDRVTQGDDVLNGEDR